MLCACTLYIVHTHQPANIVGSIIVILCVWTVFFPLTYSSFMPLFNDFAIGLYGHTTQAEKLKAQTKKERVLRDGSSNISNQSIRSHLLVELAAVVIQLKWYFSVLLETHLRLLSNWKWIYSIHPFRFVLFSYFLCVCALIFIK